MKKIISLFLTLCMISGILTAIPITASAVTSGTCGDNLTWSFDEENGVLTVSGNGDMTNWSSYTGMPWNSIKESVVNVIIETGVTSIGSLAFYDCGSLVSVKMSDTVTNIGDYSFSNCSNIKNIIIPDGVIKVGSNAFYCCTKLESAIIGNKVEYIAPFSFSCCYNLKGITFPNTVSYIGYNAFDHCSSLTNIKIGSGVARIGDEAFNRCNDLKNIEVDSENSYFSSLDGNLFNKDKTVFIRYAAGKSDSIYSIPNSVINIYEHAFDNCDNFKSVIIPDNVTTIGNYAFSSCDNLTSIIIPNNITTISDNVFEYCKNLEDVTIGNSVESIYYRAFESCSNLKSITLPKSLNIIANYAFENCYSLTNVYYNGNKESWEKLSIGGGNTYLANAIISYGESSAIYSCPEKKSGNFNFASGKKRIAEFEYDDNYFVNSSYIYNHDLARFSMRLALASYAKKTGKGENKDYSQQFINVKNLLENCEFETIEWNTDYEEKPWVNGVGVIAGNKKIKYDSGDCTLIAVAIRGGGYEAEWGGNFNVGNGEHHAGFKAARNTVIGFIQDYIDFNEIEGNIKLLITGFSRAAATANLTAAYFDDEPRLLPDSVSLTRDNLFAYCFETPAGVVSPDNESGLYDNIFSIVNQHDPVPMVAMREWDFDRYGKTLYLPASQTNSNYGNLREKMIKLYDEYIGNNEEDVAEKDKKPYTIDDFSKYAYISTITHQYDLYNAQGVYLDKIVEKLAKAIGNATNYKNNYQEAFVYIGEELIGGKDTEEFVNYLLLDLTTRLAAKKSFYLTGSLVSDKYIVRQALFDSFEYMGISVKSETIDVLLNFIIDLGFDDFITILKNFGNFGQAHYPELCMAWLDAMEETDFADVRLRTLYVNCPVDVEVYDSNSNLVAAIYSNVPQQIDGSTIIAYVDDNEQKVVYLPQDEEYRVEVLATDEGEVTYTVQEQNVSTGETKVINYNNMTVSKNDTLTGTIENLTTTENATYLLASNTVEVSEAEVIENAEPIETTTLVEGNGVVDNGGNYYKGEYVQVNAEPFDNEEFLGWYNGTQLVSKETSYRFQVTESLTLTAKFTENTCAVTLADINDDIIDIIRVVKGNTVTLGNAPEKESYTFDGLYKDNTLETSLTTEDVFYEDTTLYVKWIKNIDITSAIYTGNMVVVDATMVDNLVEKSGIVFIALYYDNRLVGLEKLAPNKDIGYIFENIEAKENNYIVKIMYWDSITKLMPLNNCEVETVQQ